jgi:hypothetical protein
VRDIWVFLDESGTHAEAERLLVGAVVAPDREAVESAVVRAFADVASQSANWETGEDIEAFIERGFHFTQDNVSVRNEFVRRLSTMNIRIHVAYSASGTGHTWHTRAASMYHQLARSILQRYWNCTVHFVFETETGMNRLYPAIIELAALGASDSSDRSERGDLSWDVAIAGKDDPALAVVDYVLATISTRLSIMEQGDFRARYAQAFAGHVAHVLDYDTALRFSSRATSLPSVGTGGHDGRARVAPGSRKSQQSPMTPQSPPPSPEAIVSDIPALAPARIGLGNLPSFLGVSAEYLQYLLDCIEANGCYSVVTIFVKGRPRLIEIPYEGLAAVQRRLLDHLTRLELDLPGCVHGYVKGRSHISNATAHVGRNHLQKFDLQDFFPSVTREAVTAVLGEAGFTPPVAERLGRLLTYQGRLPLGACTSPLLSNLCLRALDAALQALAAERGLAYTRYSDDMAFSANEAFDVRAEVNATVSAAEFQLNHSKTITVRYGQALYVTGLSVSDPAGPRLPKRFKRRLRQILYLIEKFGDFSYSERGDFPEDIEPEEFDAEFEDYADEADEVALFPPRQVVEGYVRYARAVEPSFVDGLARAFPRAYAFVADDPGAPRDVERHERLLMERLTRLKRAARLRSAPRRYNGTRHYSTEF